MPKKWDVHTKERETKKQRYMKTEQNYIYPNY